MTCTAALSPVVKYHGLARRYLTPLDFLMRPLLNGGTLGGRVKRMAELADEIHQNVTALCECGGLLAEASRYPEALTQYWAAWDLLPEPRKDWDAATWILAAIGDANFLAGDFTAGRDNLSNAMQCPGAPGNPFLHLRLGQCHFELDNLDRAADELTRAYMGGGREIFDDAERYFTFLKTRLKPTPDGW